MSNEPSKGWPEPLTEDELDVADALEALAEPDGRITLEELGRELNLSPDDK